MGIVRSKPKGNLQSKQGVYGTGSVFGGATGSNPGVEYEDIELLLIRRALKRNPESFVLNNLMMCVQFFGNYEEEIRYIKETLVSSRETELNKNLSPHKHVLLPDVLQEQVARHVGFTSTRQTIRPTIEPLHPVRIYMIHDNIDITEQNYATHYSNVNDGTMYNMVLKPTEHQGYVKLQLVDDTGYVSRIAKEDEVDLSSIAEDDDEICSDGESVYGPKPSSNLMLQKRSKQNPLRSSVYGHTRSLPDLHVEQDTYGSHEFCLLQSHAHKGRSSHNVKHESDYEHGSSAEERRYRNRKAWSKGDLSTNGDSRKHQRQMPQSKTQRGTTSHSRASSTSSGYRSGNYAMDSDSSCNTTQNTGSVHRYSGSQSESNAQSGRRSPREQEIEEYSISNGEFPRRCFKKVTYTADGKIYDPKEERKQALNSKQRRIKLALRRHNYNVFYMSSNEFMRCFSSLFVQQLGEDLGFDREAVEDMRREGAVIYCDKVMISRSFRHTLIEQYEIIPAVWLEWPNCAQEWLDRPRSTWPNYDDVEKIKDFGCHVVPEGFAPKRGSNLIEDLEWKLTFPAAERYLETCMTQAQVQVYLIALMLHKTFVRPVFDTTFGLTTSHIRNKLFWMIEENDRPSKWPENRTGECLLTLLQSLYHSISQNEPTLHDYFVRDRNLFQKVPIEHLLHTQKQLKRIIDNPVMYVFHAMENIRHNDKFFPRLDYEMLLKILTVDTLALVNPAIEHHISRQTKISSEKCMPDEKYDRTNFWDNVKMQKNQRKIYATRPVTNKTLINPRKATDSIIEISIRCAELEGPRLYALLDFFVKHFIKIAECCNQYRAHHQKTIYLNQADRLSILLSEHPRYKDDGRAYRDKIRVLRKKSLNIKSQDDPPQTPKRNPEAPIFVTLLKNRFLSESLDPASSDRDRLPPKQPDLEEPNRKVTKAVVHEVRFQDVEMEKVKTQTSPTKNEEASSPKRNLKKERRPSVPKVERESVISIAKNSDESFLTETTYI